MILWHTLFFDSSNSRPGSGTWSGKNLDYGVRMDSQVNLVLLGNHGLAEDLQNVIRVSDHPAKPD